MAIKFLVDHRVEGLPAEEFKAGQVVKDRSPESELGFVRRKLAGFLGAKGELTDHEGRPIVATTEGPAIVEAAAEDRRNEGPRSDGTPPRALAGPRTVVTSAETGDVDKMAAKAPAKEASATKPKAPAKRKPAGKRSGKGKAKSVQVAK